jgi:Ras-related protein Rab-8A
MNEAVDENFIHFRKVNIIGSENVGKFTLVQELINTNNTNKKLEKFQYSLEDNKMRLIDGLDKINVNFENKMLYLHAIRTTISTDNFDFISNNLNSLFYNSELIILMIDITNEKSFEIITELYSKIDFLEDKKILILSNKLDKNDERKVSGFSIKEFIENNNSNNENKNSINNKNIINNKNNNKFFSFEISLKEDKENFDEFIENLFNIINIDNDLNIYDIIKIQNPPKLPKSVLNYNDFHDTFNLSIFLLGSSTVGKTSFKQRFFLNNFTDNTLLTLGIDFERTMCKIANNHVKIELCDTAGQERFRAIPKQYYTKADGFLLLFDVCNEKSFKEVESWIKDINENSKGINNKNNKNNKDNKDNINDESGIITYLIGNKIDEYGKRAVSYNDGESFAKKNGIKYVEISCKSGLNVYEVMTDIIMDTFMEIKKFSKSFNLMINSKKKKKSKNCC